jgi:hypothetical protein
MALVLRIKAGVTDPEFGQIVCPTPPQGRVRGVVRLWYEKPLPSAPGIPDTPSNKFLVVGDDIGPTSGPVAQRYGEDIRSGDVSKIGGWEKLLTDRGLSIDDYINNTNFSADLALPASIIDAYTG